MFGGTYKHSIDEKGRVVIPAKYKPSLGELFVITAGIQDNSLMIMSNEEWERFFGRYASLPLTKTEKIREKFNGHQYDVSFDKQGRMQIPQQLREEFNIGEEVIIIGKGEFAEIWPPEAKAERDRQTAGKTAYDEMCELGI